MNKLSIEFQKQFAARLIFDPSVLQGIDPAAKLHEETLKHPLSSSAACLNVLGSLATNPPALIEFLRFFGLEVEELYEFPSPVSVGERMYRDKGYVVFEWVGPRRSPINERAGGRGHNRTSVDAFLLGKVGGKTTQILVEWKFTEGSSRALALGRFAGRKGVERLRRYSSVLAGLRRAGDFPFDFQEDCTSGRPESSLGLYDFSPDHLYQLLRMTLLAKKTMGLAIGEHTLEDYRIVHLTHSKNDRLNVLHPEYLTLSPGLQCFAGQPLHEVWKAVLAADERQRFHAGYWDQAVRTIQDRDLGAYLSERYA